MKNTGFDVMALEDGNAETNVGASNVSDFEDVKSDDWFYPFLDMLVSQNIIKGKSKTQFDPNGSFSFAECSAVIARYLGLENYAQERAQQLKTVSEADGNLWYGGYIQVMHELGVFDETMGLYTIKDGYVNQLSTTACNAPMKRHEFASAVAKSFELNGNLRSKNIYSEVSGLGHDFIIGGRYINSYLEKYPSYIKDYDKIPESSRNYVVKLYYNGLFIGDTEGYFNPDSNLKRSEMAKVLASILDFSMRKSLITDYYVNVPSDKLFYDANGNETLNFKYSLGVLQSSAKDFALTGDILSYVPTVTAPYGYAVDVYLFAVNNGMCKEVLKYSISNGYVNNNGFTYQKKASEDLRAILVLRNLTDNAKPELTFNVNVTDAGISTNSLIC